MDGVEAVLIQAVQAVALVPALGEDVKADHASWRVCGEGRVDEVSREAAHGALGKALHSFVHSFQQHLSAY